MDRDERDIAEGFFQAKNGIMRKIEKAKTPFTLLVTALVVVLLMWGGRQLYNFIFEDKTVISNASIREEVVTTEVLQPLEYNFTQLLFINDSGNPINLYNPITSNLYVATIDGSIPVLVNLEKAKQTVDRDFEGNPTKVTYEVPHAYPGDVALDESTTKKYVEQAGILDYNKVSADDVTALRLQAQEEQVEKLCGSGLLEKAEKRTTELITNRVQSLVGKEVKVEVKFTGDTQSTYDGEN